MVKTISFLLLLPGYRVLRAAGQALAEAPRHAGEIEKSIPDQSNQTG
jgi:hypothetical protein